MKRLWRYARTTLIATIYSAAPWALAQGYQVTTDFPPRTPAQLLQSHGITDLSKESLIAALNSNEWEVRGWAANTLAEEHYSDSIPAIEAALLREKDFNAQAHIAVALFVLHDPKGVDHLHSMCTDSSVGLEGLLPAVRELQIIHARSGVCAETVMAAMAREKEHGYISMAADALPEMYRDVPQEQASRIFNVLRNLLSDKTQDPTVRLSSSQALAQIGTPESADEIRQAIAQETDPDTRTFFEARLATIAKKQ